jgi:ABC-type transport system involved in cytochrome bd biosynthesis fused ATPase/permease subunit
MNQGKIIEMGTHNELMAKKGFYADLYNSQFLGKQEAALLFCQSKSIRF